MGTSSVIAAMSKAPKSASTLVVVPLVLTSAGITGYAHYTRNAALEQERAQHLHQHVALAWKGTR
uniref:HIG1 domain-containing protein n=1 Tax=Peronospora matthiolae TaxID=2874970 RepID=A0AAV1UHX8_9STRA